MSNKATGFYWDPVIKKVVITGTKSTMVVNKTDAHRLMMVCLAADPRWEMLPADWRTYFVAKEGR